MREKRPRKHIARETAPSLNMFRSTETPKVVASELPQSSGFQPVNKLPAISQPFTEDDSDDDTPALPPTIPAKKTSSPLGRSIPQGSPAMPARIDFGSSEVNGSDASSNREASSASNRSIQTEEESDRGPPRPPGLDGTTDEESENDSQKSEISTEGSEREKHYVIDDVLKHKWVGDSIKLLIRWEGYDESADTWEPEATIKQDAPDMLKEYYNRKGGRPVKGKGKRGRPSLANRPKPEANSAVQRQKRRADTTEDDEPELQYSPNPRGGLITEWEPPPPTENAWDDLIQRINHLEKTVNDEVIAAINWLPQGNDGKRYQTRHAYWTVRIAAPLALFAYYERETLFDGASQGVPRSALFAPPAGSGFSPDGLVEGNQSMQQRSNAQGTDGEHRSNGTSLKQNLSKRAKR